MAQTPKLGGLYGSLSKGHLGVRVPSTLQPLVSGLEVFRPQGPPGLLGGWLSWHGSTGFSPIPRHLSAWWGSEKPQQTDRIEATQVK